MVDKAPERMPVRKRLKVVRPEEDDSNFSGLYDAQGRLLDKWHVLHGKQILCNTCHCRPCPDSCPEQWMPDLLEWRARRSGITVQAWLAQHPGWLQEHPAHPEAARWQREEEMKVTEV